MDQAYLNSRIFQLETRVSMLETTLRGLCDRLGIDVAEVLPSEQEQEPPELQAVYRELFAGNKITAIKLYREFYRVGLKEAKDAIDYIAGSMRR